MPARLRRTDDELREQSGHVLWEFRQLMRLAMHIHQRQVGGVVELADPLDAAALESFCIHARALVEFLWRDRTHGPRPHKNDAVAGDWFDARTWEYEPVLPEEVRDVRRRTGWGVAHISYNRIDPNEMWGWDHVEIAHRIGYRFACFVQNVPDHRVDPAFKEEATRVNVALREQWSEADRGIVPEPTQPVGTPAHALTWFST